MKVEIVTFPETRVASITHRGSPRSEHNTVRKLVDWKLHHRLFDKDRYRSYGLHYTNPSTTAPGEHRVDMCLSVDFDIEPNEAGIVSAIIPEQRCARARDIGSRYDNPVAICLVEDWLPGSGESMAGGPIIFHYVNVGPNIVEADMITDVYLPLKTAD